MTANIIVCWVFLLIGIALLSIGVYNFIIFCRNSSEVYRAIPTVLFTTIGLIFIASSAIHWHDDDEYKSIKCSEYKVEKHITSSLDTTYTIYYK